jgi:hypothetical protein
MPSCATCGGTEDVRLYEARAAGTERPRWWWCVDCAYFAVRLNGIAADPAASWIERAALHRLPARLVGDPRDRRLSPGRRATDRPARLTRRG